MFSAKLLALINISASDVQVARRKKQGRTRCPLNDRAIAQAVSRRLPTAAVRVRAQVRSYGICDGQSGTGAGFPLPILIPSTDPHSSSTNRDWYNRPISGRRT
jgi:hypothetical protein